MHNIHVYKTAKYPGKITQLSVKRDWMEDTVDRHAYNCFPVSLANQLGWGISFPEDISFIWDGISDSSPDHVKILTGEKYCHTNRANGTISFRTGLTFKTEKETTTLIMPVPNQFIDGAQAFTTLLTTSFFSGDVPVVWRITSPGKVITIPAGTPIAAIVPITIADLNNSEINLHDGRNYVGAPFDGREYGETAERINQQGKWAGFYRNATDHLGNKIGEHEVKVIRLKTNG
jgi:hypothetical protein